MNSITVTDKGADKMIDTLSSSKLPVVTVGVHAQEGAAQSGDSGMTVADIAGIHEFGLGVPQRSWLRDFVDENRDKIESMQKTIAREIAKGGDPERALERMGLQIVGMIKERIMAGISPDILDETKKRKQKITGGGAKDTPLILWGQLLSAVASELKK